MNHNLNRQLGIEQLEDRLMLSGNVNVLLSGSTLLVRGDSAANSIRVTNDAAGGVVIRGLSGTQVNGQNNGTFTSGAVTPGELNINMRGGDDTVDMRATNATSKLQLQMASGNDDVSVNTSNATIPRNLVIHNSAGNDCVKVTNTKVGNNLYVTGRGGDDTMVVDNVDTKFLTFNMGSEDDRVKLDTVDVQRKSVMKLGPGDNQLGIIDSEFTDQVNIVGSTGSDLVGARQTNFKGSLIMNLSSGNDKAISDRTTIGSDSSDKFRLNLGSGNDVAASLGVIFKANSVLDGGGGTDNGDSDDDTSGEFITRNFETDFELNYDTEIVTLLAIDC